MTRTKAYLMIAAALCTFIASGCQQKETESLPAVVSIAQAKEVSPDLESHYSSVVKPFAQVDLAFKAPGYVNYILKVRGQDGRLRLVQEGDAIRKGTVLASIRQGDYEDRLRQQGAALSEAIASQARAQAVISESQSSLEQATIDFERTKRLFESESVTKPDFDAAKSRFEIAQARLSEAESQVQANKAAIERVRAGGDEAKIALNDCLLKAPIDGIVSARNIEVGSFVGQGAVAISMLAAKSVKVAFGVPDVSLSGLQVGKQVAVTTEALPGKFFTGAVSQIAADADPKSRVFNVEVSLPNEHGQWRTGMVAALTVRPDQKAKPVIAVPLSAVVRSSTNSEGYAVYVVQNSTGKETAQERQITVGDAFGDSIAVLSGIKAGDRVITNGSTRVVSGQEVKILD